MHRFFKAGIQASGDGAHLGQFDLNDPARPGKIIHMAIFKAQPRRFNSE
jgi:hypothetical protein